MLIPGACSVERQHGTASGGGGGRVTATNGGRIGSGGIVAHAGAEADAGSAGVSGSVQTGGVGGGNSSSSGGAIASAGASNGDGGAGGVPNVGDGSESGEAGGATEPLPTLAYDFEASVQGWAKRWGDTVTLATSTAQFSHGSSSLKVSVPALANSSIGVGVDWWAASWPQIWPGAVITFNVWSPVGSGDGLYVQAFSNSQNYTYYDPMAPSHDGNGVRTLVRGAWTTWEYTVPQTMPGGFQQLGIQIGATSFAGGDFYIDALSVKGGKASCAGTGTGSYGWETASDVGGWSISTVNGVTPVDVALSQSSNQHQGTTGSGSLKVALTAIPSTERRLIVLQNPRVYCGQTVTFNVWVPTNTPSLSVQTFAEYNKFSGWKSTDVGQGGRGAWTTVTVQVPEFNANGIELIGIEVYNNSTTEAFTGDIYIDNVSW
ncbi:MAG: hypothetical protein QM756_24405 [Polyangiaceae bacterium]